MMAVTNPFRFIAFISQFFHQALEIIINRLYRSFHCFVFCTVRPITHRIIINNRNHFLKPRFYLDFYTSCLFIQNRLKHIKQSFSRTFLCYHIRRFFTVVATIFAIKMQCVNNRLFLKFCHIHSPSYYYLVFIKCFGFIRCIDKLCRLAVTRFHPVKFRITQFFCGIDFMPSVCIAIHKVPNGIFKMIEH
nr:MAG TPA: hypothetical protein [Bacteriophage sp.]